MKKVPDRESELFVRKILWSPQQDLFSLHSKTDTSIQLLNRPCLERERAANPVPHCGRVKNEESSELHRCSHRQNATLRVVELNHRIVYLNPPIPKKHVKQ